MEVVDLTQETEEDRPTHIIIQSALRSDGYVQVTAMDGDGGVRHEVLRVADGIQLLGPGRLVRFIEGKMRLYESKTLSRLLNERFHGKGEPA
ncbi:MAG: hypothetical protein D6746_14565 [Bacteroidetes bacterium]|nr:MAG: hypothetical protein D6746_14565 [Bacteroidota bacterium]